jgi:hypothetical protein
MSLFNQIMILPYSFISCLTAALSAEEDRLWNIVTANSSDFTAWTSLIEETEKLAEVCYVDLILRRGLHFENVLIFT